jgi:membrane protein implicated in regulation of membrane protease activity
VSPKLRDPFTVILEWRRRLIPDLVWFALGALVIAVGSIAQDLSFHFVVPAALVVVAVVLVLVHLRRRAASKSDTGGTAD